MPIYINLDFIPVSYDVHAAVSTRNLIALRHKVHILDPSERI